MIKNILIYGFFALLACLQGCAPAPGEKLYSFLSEPTPLEEIKITKTIGFEITTQKCGQAILEERPGLWFANLFLNFGVFPACAIVSWEDGKIKTCDIYSVTDTEWIIKHELRHCQGYRDTLY